MRTNFIFTSESVTEGHPDKLCDQISDAVVDHYLQSDPFSRIIAECAVASGVVFIAARFASQAKIDIPDIARQVIQQAGYVDGEFNAKDCTILTSFHELPENEYHQSNEKDLNSTQLSGIKARRQVNAFGYACDQTAALMPLPIVLAHNLARRLTAVRLRKHLRYLRPDGKAHVAIEYHERRPHRIHSITLIASHQSQGTPGPEQFHEDMLKHVITPVFKQEEIRPDEQTKIFINPDRPFITGGPSIHSGLTGRKNAVDTYGEYSRQAEAALSGKDPSRIDRVGAYAARYAAKNVVAAGLARECEVHLSYSIGFAQPVSIQVETFGTAHIPDTEIARRLQNHFDFRLGAIIGDFNLRFLPATLKGGFYRKLAAYGHIGRMDMGLPWEKVDKVALLNEGRAN
jgi:S-adenosylmethionine synthetase